MNKDGKIMVAILIVLILAVVFLDNDNHFDYLKARATMQAEYRADAPRLDACIDRLSGDLGFDDAYEACKR